MILCSGGMSVDPDDRTPGAIKDTGADIVTYGAPVLPGAMLLLAYLDHRGRRKHSGQSDCRAALCTPAELFLTWFFPGFMADDPDLQQQKSAGYGEGGLCLNCAVCTFPGLRIRQIE